MTTSTTAPRAVAARAAAITEAADAFCETFGRELRALEFGKCEDISIPGRGDTLAGQRLARYDGYTEVMVAVRRLALEQGVQLAVIPIPTGLRLLRLGKNRA